MMRFAYCLIEALIAGLLFSEIALAGTLSIANKTTRDIINIHVSSAEKDFFLRLDLLPGATDSIENPELTADLRVDTGLELWNFQAVNLKQARNLSFFEGKPVFLDLTTVSGKVIRIDGAVQSMVPEHGGQPVCSLEKFHPAMTMKDVCAIFPDEMPRDDNGALLTGLGFAGLTWASRLIPARDENAKEDSLLEHLELRRPLAQADTEKLLKHLFQQGYVPWQAEFPGKDEQFGAEPAVRSEAHVLEQVDRFLASQLPVRHNDHSLGKKCVEASILMAPGNILPQLETADEPESDVQIFTVVLRPCTGVLLLDVAAYSAAESQGASLRK